MVLCENKGKSGINLRNMVHNNNSQMFYLCRANLNIK